MQLSVYKVFVCFTLTANCVYDVVRKLVNGFWCSSLLVLYQTMRGVVLIIARKGGRDEAKDSWSRGVRSRSALGNEEADRVFGKEYCSSFSSSTVGRKEIERVLDLKSKSQRGKKRNGVAASDYKCWTGMDVFCSTHLGNTRNKQYHA
jgi:hypothetical protein